MKKIFKRIFKITLIAALVLGVMFFMMAKFGGDNPVFKETLESHIAKTTGYHARIEQFNALRIFPYIIIDFDDLRLYAPSDDKNSVGGIKRFRLALSFWDAMFSTGKIIKLELDELNAPAGTITPAELYIQSVKIDEENSEIKANGSYGENKFTVVSDIEISGIGRTRKYSFAKEREMSLNLGDISAKSHIRDTYSGVRLSNIEVTQGKNFVFGGKLKIKHKRKNKTQITGEITTGKERSKAAIDLLLSPSKEAFSVSGEVVLNPLYVPDIESNAPLRTFVVSLSSALQTTQPAPNISFKGKAINISFNAKTITMANHNWGHLSGDILLKDGQLTVKSTSGKIAGGKASMLIDMAATGDKPAIIEMKYHVEGVDPKALPDAAVKEHNAKGEINLSAHLKSQGATPEEINQNMVGGITLIGSGSALGAGAVDLWSGGLVNALLPDTKEDDQLEIRCIVADFNVQNQKIEAETLFLDSPRVTIMGSGSYDIAKDNLNFTITPQSKNLSIGRIVDGLSISGPIKKPSFAPDALGVGKKIGGLMLGLVNPALFAIPLSDLGMSEDNPCLEYIGKSGELEVELKEPELPSEPTPVKTPQELKEDPR